MKLTYKQRIFTYFFIIFALFAVCIIIFEQKEEKNQRTLALQDRLDSYAEMIHSYAGQNHLTDSSMSQIMVLANAMPMDIRITMIDEQGKVLFDKDVDDISKLDNHLERPEIRNASFQGKGTNIRMSASTQQEYLYYAKNYKDYFVRVALPYNIQTKGMMKADNFFVYIVIAMFIVVLLLLNYVAGRFGSSISQLKNLTTKIKDDKPLTEKIDFPDDELGEIGSQLVDILKQKEKSKHEIEVEREKLIQHFHYSQEGICIFDKDIRKIYANTNFFQYFNFIVDQPVFNLEAIIKEEVFDPVIEFINHRKSGEHYHNYQIKKNGKTFSIQTIVFEDSSFEITIKDITKTEKTRLLKQEMTNNIAHELRTPVTSLRGYLETLNTQELPDDKRAQFIDRAYQQTIRLSTLIEDVSLISKIEEAPSQFTKESVNLWQLINDVRIDLTDKLQENDIKLNVKVDEELTIDGNYTLLYSIFRNMLDNSISYGGQHINVNITNYMEDEDYVYFSYCDTGKGVDEQYLPRLFERFYRVNEGRTRTTGGSGLGLSIVKNAVLFHKGEIQVKNRAGGGLEFFFTLRK
ncbi:two-component system phosphate regulon sensor histidine kinase PhoR [Dysgonomonas sp. PFB1-18]|uniref:sensor histidine kinase n=1 Tax=unclassified Dysgonomonas TaxID=2630389 RepID=UPI00247320A0|nr:MULTISPECIES: ATP-binding protein [unclassified Dysgonomonas]MDH6309354.1 two-component system phosphate regulon sensor histidine kinase PhoR [Dysgonomonas sp. PF1-14]MDH6339781.1 two-component system phosphate regulon sensor histidine kinase PhoR [Dysgonomonas sp. PF1-16]MDH6381429.1 two-component system phosphate regulon sensor histidine kinase PhoR [Dysgonomonas sp. PFB1-18]MDH6398644.1 two-component system phosphate regulon sensor histidine kinase PhoR [Dysgonomonas sp. PF1-23]